LICGEYLNNRVKLEIIDVLEDPEKAEQAKILATPTLIRESPGPHRRLVGDLGETERIIQLLGLHDWVQARKHQ
jgi:circadian clock protein KaiB